MEKLNNIHVVDHEKVHYVAGLNWQVIDTQSARRSRKQARAEGAEYYLVWRQPDTVLLGMTVLSAFQETRDRQAYRSLALHVLPLLPKDGYAVIPLTESTLWFVATLGGQLSPLSDIVGSAEQIKKAINVFVTMNPQPAAGWQVIAPDGFLPGETQPPPGLTDWLVHDRTRKTPRLSPTNVKAAAGLWIALLVLLLAGHFGWQYLQERRENAEIAAAKAALAAKR
ncbi:type 4b pilus protein PilO2, partial [Salmonella enterica subsp. enterica serovar Baildon]|nr:type 4b pilus protein PilO2 [Salmonella enterica subsp. enterica serovar Baildon]